MKYITLIISIGLLLFFISCNEDEPVTSKIDEQSSGKLFLKIDKENAPESVVWIDAFLTRTNFDTISESMNLLSDSTADLLLEDLQSGEWHLQIDASDSNNIVLYTGETDINIFAGFTTQINLVLQPTGAGTGNIYIWVTWGNLQGNWVDFIENPILSPSNSYYESYGVAQSNILFNDNIYKMWYLGDAGGSNKFVMYAESNDAVIWAKPFTNPVLYPGIPGSWDDLAVQMGAIIFESGSYKLFYSGFSDPYGPWHIGLATSSDGINWNKHPYPILYAAGGQEFQIVPSSIIKINNVYYLFYNGRNLPYLDIRLATSTDGVNWTKYSGNPILTSNQGWEGSGVYNANVYEKNGNFEMVYMNAQGTGFGRATSSDGIAWEKDELNPFFTKEDTNNHWANYKIAYPFFIRINNHDRIYYTGFSSNGPFKIGFVEK